MKSTYTFPTIAAAIILTLSISSCTQYYEWECNGMNPEGVAMVPAFDDTTVTYADTLGNTLGFHVADTLYFDPGCLREIVWQLDGTGTNMRMFFTLNAPLPQSYQNDSSITFDVSIDTDVSNINEGFMAVDFDIDRLDTATVSFVKFGRYKYDVIPSLTTPSQTYNHVYVCTDLDAVTGSSIVPDKIYFHKGTGCIGFHDLTANKNWYFQP